MERPPSPPSPGCSDRQWACGSPLPRTTPSRSPSPTSSSSHIGVGVCYFFLKPRNKHPLVLPVTLCGQLTGPSQARGSLPTSTVLQPLMANMRWEGGLHPGGCTLASDRFFLGR